MLRVVRGFLKGAGVGGAAGYGLLRLGLWGGGWAYLACAAVGAVVGVVAGRPPWRAETLFTPLVKMIFGAAVGAGLCALGLQILPELSVPLGPETVSLRSAPLLALAVGVLYGVFVEVDDGQRDEPTKPAGGRGEGS